MVFFPLQSRYLTILLTIGAVFETLIKQRNLFVFWINTFLIYTFSDKGWRAKEFSSDISVLQK